MPIFVQEPAIYPPGITAPKITPGVVCLHTGYGGHYYHKTTFSWLVQPHWPLLNSPFYLHLHHHHPTCPPSVPHHYVHHPHFNHHYHYQYPHHYTSSYLQPSLRLPNILYYPYHQHVHSNSILTKTTSNTLTITVTAPATLTPRTKRPASSTDPFPSQPTFWAVSRSRLRQCLLCDKALNDLWETPVAVSLCSVPSTVLEEIRVSFSAQDNFSRLFAYLDYNIYSISKFPMTYLTQRLPRMSIIRSSTQYEQPNQYFECNELYQLIQTQRK